MILELEGFEPAVGPRMPHIRWAITMPFSERFVCYNRIIWGE